MRSPIGSDYYVGKTLLITGATGLVGKALIEAILRKLPQVARVYVLIRPRPDGTTGTASAASTLWTEILGSSAFEFLRARHGDEFAAFVEHRLVAVEGDLSKERLGLGAETYQRLRDEVDVVINSGALAVFDAPLDQAVETNTLGPGRVLEFARTAAKRPFVAHVSTCYVSNVGGPVFESAHPPDWTPAGQDAGEPFDVDHEVERLLAHVSRRRAEGRDDALVADGLRWARWRGWKDTYTFTKAMGEQSFTRHQGDVPGLILRPSVIESALWTPSPGWIDGYRMVDPLIVGYARGQITEFPGNPESVLDLVPVDVVVNALLMSIPWSHVGGGPTLYHVASGTENPLTVKRFRDYVQEHFERAPLRNAHSKQNGGLPHLSFPDVRSFLRRLEFGYLLPLKLLEAGYAPLQGTAWGKRRHASLGLRRARLEWLRNTAAIYGPYGESQAQFVTYHWRAMWRALPASDRRAFPFDIRRLDWKRYLQEVHLPGIERYLLRLGRRRKRPVALPAPPVEEDTPGPAVAGDELARPEGEPGRWRRAERVLALTRELGAQEARAWTTPLHEKAIKWLSVQIIRAVSHTRLELSCVGREHIPERGPFIVVANHTSHVDTGVLLAALGPHAMTAHPTAAADYWFRSPLVAWFLHATLGGVPFDRHRPNVPRALALPAQVLRNGNSLIFYPEGTRSPDGELRPFRSTVGLLALASGAQIVPAYITGASRALPKGRKLIRHHPVRVRFGPPTTLEPYLASLDGESVASVSRRVALDAHAAVRRLRDLALPAGAEASR